MQGKIVLLRFHVYATFYGHLFDKATKQMVAHESSPQKCNKIGNATIAFGELHLAPLLASAAVTFLMNSNFRVNHHPLEVVSQMERPMSV